MQQVEKQNEVAKKYNQCRGTCKYAKKKHTIEKPIIWLFANRSTSILYLKGYACSLAKLQLSIKKLIVAHQEWLWNKHNFNYLLPD